MLTNTIDCSAMKNTIKLPEAQKDLQFPLMKAIEIRRTKRKWKDEKLTDQEISNLLWAACGITSKASKRGKSRRAAPSACNSQEIKIYVAVADGLFLYDEEQHQLVKILPDDIRAAIGTQKMMQSAPVGLIYVSDYTKLKSFFFRNDDQRWMTSATDTGFISQNVYLYCAAAGLSTAILGLINRSKLHQRMGLNDHERIVYTQVIGKSPDN